LLIAFIKDKINQARWGFSRAVPQAHGCLALNQHVGNHECKF